MENGRSAALLEPSRADEDRAARMLRDAEHLRRANPELFLRVAAEIAARAGEVRAAESTGADHPLAELLSRKPDAESRTRLREGIREFRKNIGDTSEV